MPQSEYIYDAFISYRHLPVDMEVAVRLQQLLERHKDNSGSRLRVFRDQSELPTSGDLGSDIRHAVEQSRFLIVVCSPGYKESKWCMAELEYFRSLHGQTNRNILPILVEGEPEESFPLQLRWESGTAFSAGKQVTVRREVEPLGADVRANGKAGRMKKLKTEYLRLAAPMLGCGFDDLYNRAQRRRRRIITAVSAAVTALAVAFSVYSAYMLDQISRRQQLLEAKQAELYNNESRRLANESLLLLGEDPYLAALLADAALPADLENPDFTVPQEAELAIRSAALQLEFSRSYSPLTLNATVCAQSHSWFVSGFYADGQLFSLKDGDTTCLYDARYGQLICRIDSGDVLFTTDGESYLIKSEDIQPDGDVLLSFSLHDTGSGNVLAGYEITVDADEAGQYFAAPSVQGDCIYVLHIQDRNSNAECVCDGYFKSGKFRESDAMPEDMKAHYEAAGAPAQMCSEYDPPSRYSDKQGDVLTYLFNAYPDWSVYSWSELTADERLCFVYYSRGSESGLTALWAVDENRLLGAADGTCFQPEDNGMFYCLTEDAVQIYSYNPGNFALDLSGDNAYTHISADGSRAAFLSGQIGSMELSIWDTVNMSEPIFSVPLADDACYLISIGDEYYKYRITPDMKYVMLSDAVTGALVIYDVDSSQIVFSCEAEDACEFCLSSDGSMAAVLYGDAYSTCTAVVYDVVSGGVIAEFEINTDDAMYHNSGDAAQMELSDGRLAVSYTCATWICELPDSASGRVGILLRGSGQSGQVYVIDHPLVGQVIEQARSLMGYDRCANTDTILTADGLVIASGFESTAYGDRWRVNCIYDTVSRRVLNFDPVADLIPGSIERFYYDEVSGSLIIQKNNHFSVQRRNTDGDFEEVYRIVSRDPGCMIMPQLSPCDGICLVLNGDTQTEIYSISDGSLLYVLGCDGGAAFGVIDGSLYDLRCGQGGGLFVSDLPDTSRSREYVRSALTADGISRSLSLEECESYYVPQQWRR